MRRALLLVMVTACGRLGFDASRSASDAQRGDAQQGDGSFDAPKTVHMGRPNVTILGTYGPMAATMFDAWITTNAQNRSSITGSTTINDAALANTDLIILVDPQKTYSFAESASIAKVVGRGGALLGLSGFSAGDITLFNSAVFAFDVQAIGSTSTDGPVTTFASHPITAGITSLPFTGGDEITLNAPGVPLAKINGLDIAMAFDYQLGRVMIWGDEWVTYDMTWNANVQTFWDNALAWVWPTQ